MGCLWEVEMRNGKRIGLLFILFGTAKIRKREKKNYVNVYYFGLQNVFNQYIRFHQNL